MGKHLLSNNIIGVTETQLDLRENAEDIKMKLEKHFSAHFNCNFQNYRSITIGYSSWIRLVDSENYSSITVLPFLKNKR